MNDLGLFSFWPFLPRDGRLIHLLHELKQAEALLLLWAESHSDSAAVKWKLHFVILPQSY